MCSRDYNVECVTSHLSVLGHNVQYSMETNGVTDHGAPGDHDISISTQDDEADNLRQECRKWAVRVARETKTISEIERRLNALKRSTSRAILSGSRDVSREEVEARIEELEHILRRTRTSKMKDETKISYLKRELGQEVERWLSDLPMPTEEDSKQRKLDILEMNRKLSVANFVNK